MRLEPPAEQSAAPRASYRPLLRDGESPCFRLEPFALFHIGRMGGKSAGLPGEGRSFIESRQPRPQVRLSR